MTFYVAFKNYLIHRHDKIFGERKGHYSPDRYKYSKNAPLMDQGGHINGCHKLYLTLVGGGVFGNDLAWILEAIGLAARKFAYIPLEVHIVQYQ